MTLVPDAALVSLDRFEDAASECLILAGGFAQATGHPTIRAGHILLAVLQQDRDRVDAACRVVLGGLKAGTLADLLRPGLAIDAGDGEPGDFSADRLRQDHLHETANLVLEKARLYAKAWGASRVPLLALTCAACEVLDESTERMLRKISLNPPTLSAVAVQLASTFFPASDAVAIEVFRDGYLRLEVFEPVVQAALRSLAALAGERPLLDADLLAALAGQADSRIARALEDAGVRPDQAQARLVATDPPAAPAAPPSDRPIAAPQVGRLLNRVLIQAVDIARDSGSPIILESHLLLAHLDRVAEARGNLYERVGLDTKRLRTALTPEPVAKSGGIAVFVDKLLAPNAFGPLARAAWESLAGTAAERTLLDSDLLYALLSQPESRFLEALHVMGAPVPAIRRTLQQMAGRASSAPVRPVGRRDIPEERVGRLLQRVLRGAVALAVQDGSRLVAESHLLRAHIDCVAGSSYNMYERFGIDTARVLDALRRHQVDPEPATAAVNGRSGGTVTDIDAYLNGRVVNQPDAVQRAARALKRMRSGLGEPGQVMGKFLFLGATGVGKTELARALADIAFGPKPGVRDPYMIRVDCGNFQHHWDVVQLIGASQGLVGYKEGQLTNGLREKPRAVILFDEAEKAHPTVWQSLLPLFDEGLVREADGTVYDATNCLIVATSNSGYREAIEALDVWNHPWADVRLEVEQRVWQAVQTYFSPEFRARFGRENIIFFNHFSREDYARIIVLQLDALVDEMRGRGIEVTFEKPKAVVALLTELAWASRQEGARPVRRLITELVRDQMISARTADPDRLRFRFEAREGTGTLVLREA